MSVDVLTVSYDITLILTSILKFPENRNYVRPIDFTFPVSYQHPLKNFVSLTNFVAAP